MLKKAYTLIQAPVGVLVLILVLTGATIPAQSQIFFKNPSFEGLTPGFNKVPPDWIFHTTGVGYPAVFMDKSFWGGTLINLNEAYNGLTYVALGGGYSDADNVIVRDGYYQQLTCQLKAGIAYSFSYYGLGFYSVGYVAPYQRGSGIKVWLLDDQLKKIQLVSTVDSLDTMWTKVVVSFVPAQDCRTILFEQYNIIYNSNFLNYSEGAGLDYLSPITFPTKDYITATISDTLLTAIKPVKLGCRIKEDSSNNYTYSWRSEPPGFTNSEQNPTAFPAQSTTYIVTAHYNCGMDLSDTVKVRINLASLWFPNVFTPNNDGRDDKFGAIYNDAKSVNNYTLMVYNRWGQLIFNTTNVKDRWDGTYNGKPMEQGTYMYRVTYTLEGKEYIKKGDVELIR